MSLLVFRPLLRARLTATRAEARTSADVNVSIESNAILVFNGCINSVSSNSFKLLVQIVCHRTMN